MAMGDCHYYSDGDSNLYLNVSDELLCLSDKPSNLAGASPKVGNGSSSSRQRPGKPGNEGTSLRLFLVLLSLSYLLISVCLVWLSLISANDAGGDVELKRANERLKHDLVEMNKSVKETAAINAESKISLERLQNEMESIKNSAKANVNFRNRLDQVLEDMDEMEQSVKEVAKTNAELKSSSLRERDDAVGREVGFAVLRTGGIKNGKIAPFNDTLYSFPSSAFDAAAGAFTAPHPGAYDLSFSGTSHCGENKVSVRVNGKSLYKYYDRDGSWKNGTLSYAYVRGWTQRFALALEVGDTVELWVDCDSSKSSWNSHQPGAQVEHHGHRCFYSNFYFFGRLLR